MREIVLDTETTGLIPTRASAGRDRPRELDQSAFPAAELSSLRQSRARHAAAKPFAVHGLSAEFSQGQAALRRRSPRS